MTTTTIVYSPHPDDETLRLSAYVAFAAARGDRLVLVAVTDGGASNVATSWGWTPQMLQDHRKIEQAHAWDALTGTYGTIIRLGITDGSVPASTAKITAKARVLEALYAVLGPVEHYVAAKDNDAHADHRAVVAAVKAAGVPIVRVSSEPGTGGGTAYVPKTPADISAVTKAHNAYRPIGWASVPTLFQNLKDQKFASYISR